MNIYVSLNVHVQDITHTGEAGYNFLKIDSGMTEVGDVSCLA